MSLLDSPLFASVATGGGIGQAFNHGVEQAQQQQGNQQALQAGAMQLQAAQQQQAQQQAYSTDVSNWIAGGSKPDELPALAAKYPQQAKALQDVWKFKSDAQKQADSTFFGTSYAALANGKPQLALQSLQARRDAEAKAGGDTSELDALIQGLQDGSDKDGSYAKAAILAHIYGSDPDKFADVFGLSGKDKTHVLTAGGALVDDTGKVLYKANEKTEYKTVKKADGSESIVAVGGGDPSSGAGGASGGSGAPRSAPVDANGKFDARAFFKQFTGPHEGGYAAHDANGAPVNMGINAAANPDVDLKNLTPDQAADIFATKYAPKAADLPPALAAVYADTAFINPKRADQFLAASGGDPQKFLTMRRSWQNNLVNKQPEKYAPYAKAWTNRNNDLAAYVGQGSATQASSGGRVVYDSSTGTNGGGPEPDITGDSYLATLPPSRAATIKAIAEGRSIPPKPGSRYGQALLEQVAQYDPTFDAANATSRQKTRVDFTSGKSAIAVNALNTAMGHLLHLDDQAHDLGNFSTMPGLLNPLYNKARMSAGNTALPAFDQTKQAAASEMRKVFAGSGGGNLTELEAWEKSLNSSLSYEQLHAAIKNGVTLMSSRLDALKDQYTTGMGRSDQVPTFLKPSLAKKANERFGVDLSHNVDSPAERQGAASATPAAPPQGATRIGSTPDGRAVFRIGNRTVVARQ